MVVINRPDSRIHVFTPLPACKDCLALQEFAFYKYIRIINSDADLCITRAFTKTISHCGLGIVHFEPITSDYAVLELLDTDGDCERRIPATMIWSKRIGDDFYFSIAAFKTCEQLPTEIPKGDYAALYSDLRDADDESLNKQRGDIS